jgi:hypothetical protein
MSFPQPNSDQYAIGGYQFFRLTTPLVSPGDIYESTQSGHALAVGPTSDIANVNIAYFDDQAPNFMARTTISPSRALVGRVDARNEATYSPSNRPGKIMFWAADIFDPNYRPFQHPLTFNPATDQIQFVQPVLDVIEYFKPQSSLTPGRDDAEFVFQNYPVTTRRFFLVVPYYGRKYCYVNFTNRLGIGGITFGIVGLNYAITQDDSANPYHQETTLLAEAAIGAGNSVTKVIRAASDGCFDALVFSISDAGPAPLRILMSDLVEP